LVKLLYTDKNAKILAHLEFGRKHELFEVLSPKNVKKLHILTKSGNGYIRWPSREALEVCLDALELDPRWADSGTSDVLGPEWLYVWDDYITSVYKLAKAGKVEVRVEKDEKEDDWRDVSLCMRRKDLEDVGSYAFGKKLLGSTDRRDKQVILEELTGLPRGLFEKSVHETGGFDKVTHKLANELETLHSTIASIRGLRVQVRAFEEVGGTPDSFISAVGLRAKQALEEKAALWAAGGVVDMELEEGHWGWRHQLQELAQEYLDGKL
jgi:hypothetical protein